MILKNEKNDCVLKNTKKIRLGIKPHIRQFSINSHITSALVYSHFFTKKLIRILSYFFLKIGLFKI